MSEQAQVTESATWTQGVSALARDIVERRTGMPAYLVDDETWATALDEAEATYVPEPPETPIQRAVRRARGDLRGEEVEAAIQAYNRGACGEGDFDVTDNGDGSFTATRLPLSPESSR